MSNAGRPKIEIDWREFDKLCALQATLVEIAGWFDCSVDTIERRVKEEKAMNFAEYYALRSSKGKISLRRKQWKLADTNANMAIFLGKNYLGQRDVQDQDNYRPIVLKYNLDDRPEDNADSSTEET